MSCNQPSPWHHSCQQQDILSTTPAHLQPVLKSVFSDLEFCTAETVGLPPEALILYLHIHNYLPCILLCLDMNGTIVSVNQFGASCLGYKPQELIDKPIFNLFASSEQQRLSEVLIGLLEESSTGKVSRWEFPLDCPGSKMDWVRVMAQVLHPGENSPVIMMVCEDITAQKQAEAALAQFQKASQEQFKEMQTVNHLKEEFLSTISHELRTPLTNMKMAIQMLSIILNQEQNMLSELSKPQIEGSKAARYFQILTSECDREINLINNFLDLQRLETSIKPIILEKIKLQEWLVRVVNAFSAKKNCSDKEVQVSVEANLPPFSCDPFSLEKIIIEMLTNACKFSPKGEKIIVKAESLSQKIQLQVTNTGVEIPPAELPRIFEKFYRIPSNDFWKRGGTGLGLALVQKLTHRMGGTIKVESGSNRTCFTIQFPMEIRV
ncbi:MAG: PAS domain-containing sensor histidine kinase [Scytonema sp. PMC 1069.18]|nr:PAS domain-containing sensor histidine kinase [Scytonema sp. PMC 1069.18]MEC4880594.1 PAS domain-containing sensor histidine kinase [Scytonema sp. PMC 1070.18]